MGARLLDGAPAAPGLAIGPAWSPSVAPRGHRLIAPEDREREGETALAALAAAAADLDALARRLPEEEAEIIRTGALMAADPGLSDAVKLAIRDEGTSAGDAIVAATAAYADVIAAVADPTLAARADDVRSLGRRAARLATEAPADGADAHGPAPPPFGVILIAQDVGPADVAELASSLAGVALVGGGVTAHAAIVARSLGLPMVTDLGSVLLEVPTGTTVLLDGGAGSLAVEPPAQAARTATGAMRARARDRQRDAADRELPSVTRDGWRVPVLANVASVAELEVALGAGAEGVGLLRTELAFLDAVDWPSEADHLAAIEPILRGLGPRPATVRVLDFGADKCPPFLYGTDRRGIALLLGHEEPFVRQLRAILHASRDRDVRILLPMVDHPDQLDAARELIERTARRLGIGRRPPVGAMIETPAAADAARALAAHADFLSIGTNDLTAETLGADRFAVNGARPHHPRVLRLIARSVTAAHEAAIAIEVCGEAASDPMMLPLLVGLEVDELSAGAARVADARRWVRCLTGVEARVLALAALGMTGTDEVAAAVGPLAQCLASAQRGDAVVQRVDRSGRILAFGA